MTAWRVVVLVYMAVGSGPGPSRSPTCRHSCLVITLVVVVLVFVVAPGSQRGGGVLSAHIFIYNRFAGLVTCLGIAGLMVVFRVPRFVGLGCGLYRAYSLRRSGVQSIGCKQGWHGDKPT